MRVILHDAAATWEDAGAAATAILFALVLAWAANRVIQHAEVRLASREGRRSLDPAGKTRLRLVRRLIFAVIVGAGVCVALLQFDSFDKLAGALLASSAVVGAIAGLAARQSLANVIAGVTLALTQPIRVGDLVEIGDERGRVEDLTLTFTWLRTADGRHIALPNELLMTLPLRNDTLGSARIVPATSVWIAGDADADAALGALRALEEVDEAAIDEVDSAGVRLRVAGAATAAGERAAAEETLRRRALAALRSAGVPGPPAGRAAA
jgi:small-conductance mechanosensitive channel